VTSVVSNGYLAASGAGLWRVRACMAWNGKRRVAGGWGRRRRGSLARAGPTSCTPGHTGGQCLVAVPPMWVARLRPGRLAAPQRGAGSAGAGEPSGVSRPTVLARRNLVNRRPAGGR